MSSGHMLMAICIRTSSATAPLGMEMDSPISSSLPRGVTITVFSFEKMIPGIVVSSCSSVVAAHGGGERQVGVSMGVGWGKGGGGRWR